MRRALRALRALRARAASIPKQVALTLILAGAAVVAHAAPTCVVGVSKDLCKGQLIGPWSQTKCIRPGGVACQTATANQASFKAPITPGGLICDETPELNGLTLQGFFPQINLRLQNPDPMRGSLVGRFSIVTSGGVAVASGNFEATLGVGTHRPNCAGNCNANRCEQCYAATFVPSLKAWQVHTEGFLNGQLTSGPHAQCSIRWSLAGTFTVPGSAAGPSPNAPWSFCGTVDGVLECPCK